MTTVEIHEFSTGITPQRLADGSWVSCGFTGQYMNSTLNPIPHSVERSIANKGFAVAEGASSDRPTIIGREIGTWHVVAFVTKGRDEKGRGASFYRYFLTEAQNGLSLILSMLRQWDANGQQVTFNPYAQVVAPYRISPVAPNPISRVDSQIELPEILALNRDYTPEEVNERAIAYSRLSGQPTSWAFNVEALEQPNRFQVILPANDAAARRIRQSLSTTPAITATHSIDEQAVKTAIKNLINTSQPKPASFQTLASSMDDVQGKLGDVATKQFWNPLFSSQGADKAIKQKIYSESMVRLLTIRAMVLPHTLSSFWDWLGNIPDKKQRKALVRSSLSMQAKGATVANSFTSLQQSLLDGVNIITTAVFNKRLSPGGACQLLSRESMWGKVLPQHIQNIKHDAGILLPQRRQRAQSSQAVQSATTSEWQSIIRGLRSHRSPKDTQNTRYVALGEMFAALNEPVLAACCHQAGSGLVPSEIYKAASHRNDFNGGKPYGGHSLKRKKTTAETILAFLGHPLTLGVIGVSVLALILWIFRGSLDKVASRILPNNQNNPQLTQTENETEKDTVTPPDTDEVPLGNSEILKDTESPEEPLTTEGTEKFPSNTYIAIGGLVTEGFPEASNLNSQVAPEKAELDAIQQVIETLLNRDASGTELNDLNYRAMLKSVGIPQKMDPIYIKRWRALVYTYQKRKGDLATDGSLTKPGETYEALRKDLSTKASPSHQENTDVDDQETTPPNSHQENTDVDDQETSSPRRF